MAEQSTSQSRRTVLGASVGALVALAAQALGRPSPTRANGENVVVGSVLATGSASTGVTTTTGNGLQGTSSDVNASGMFGQHSSSGVGIGGQSVSGAGAYGKSSSGSGVFGTSSLAYGVLGQTDNGGAGVGIGVVGQGRFGAPGMLGYSGSLTVPAPPQFTGVWALSFNGPNSRGVTGQVDAGRGIDGIATTGTAVFGKATSGEGIHGESDGSNGVSGKSGSGIAAGVYGENTAGGYGVAAKSSTGVGVSANTSSGTAVNALAESGGTGITTTSIGGTALQVNGRTSFSTSGLTTVPVGATSKLVNPGISLSSTSRILCTLESNQGTLAIQRVTKNTVAGTFTVFLSRAVATGKSAKVAWFVIG